MEKLIIQSAEILFADSPFYRKKADVVLEDGKVVSVGEPGSLDHSGLQAIPGEGRYLAPGFLDLNVNFGEPGLETKEDLASGCAAAAAGGFTGVALQPNTQPPLHTRSEISFIRNSTRDSLVSVYPVGTITKNREGNELAELYDMKVAGAVAFSDGDKSLQHAGLMGRALLYSKGFGGKIFAFAENKSIAGNAKMNEGVMSTYLGMKGNPNMAEELMVSQYLFLARYNEASLHITTISTAGSVDLIRAAKQEGLAVTCDVGAHHLFFTDDDLSSFDSNFKVKPPLRTEADRLALLEGLADGTIDAIVSQHTPHEIEFKNVEFEIASYGITGLQTVLPILLRAGLSMDLIVEKLSAGPRRILGLEPSKLEEGGVADLVLINPDELWIFDRLSNRSKAINNPLFNTELKGKVNFIANNQQTIIF
jgi:dihydroorotase